MTFDLTRIEQSKSPKTLEESKEMRQSNVTNGEEMPWVRALSGIEEDEAKKNEEPRV